jgi:hypothetical protein
MRVCWFLSKDYSNLLRILQRFRFFKRNAWNSSCGREIQKTKYRFIKKSFIYFEIHSNSHLNRECLTEIKWNTAVQWKMSEYSLFQLMPSRKCKKYLCCLSVYPKSVLEPTDCECFIWFLRERVKQLAKIFQIWVFVSIKHIKFIVANVKNGYEGDDLFRNAFIDHQ